MDKSLTHINERGEMNIVDISDKVETKREALAEGYINLNKEILEKIKNEKIKKGDIFAAARFSAINGAKKTSELIPLCHPLPISAIEIDFNPHDEIRLKIYATVRTKSQTGVEMEALVAAGIASLTVYDMCKAVDRGMTIESTQLLEKIGGKSGRWNREDQVPGS